ncbi:type VI secretion system tip protein VgrG [Photorhabdus viridis]|uniref:type VI secretion system tip protein VgrG n=1 Tax=Photorhabdus viridis TaxID=3163327 RepID=UPI003307397F
MSPVNPSASSLKLVLWVGGKKLTALAPLLIEIQAEVNRIPSAKLVLNTEGNTLAQLDAETEKEVSLCMPGSTLRVDAKSGQTLFSGIVMNQSLRLQKGRSELTLMVVHPLKRLTASLRSQVFMDEKEGDVLRELCSAQNIKVNKLAGMHVTHPQMVQFTCSDWQFITARLRANGVWLIPELDGISVIKPALSGHADHILDNKSKQGVGIEEAEWRFTCQEQPKQLAVSAWDIQEQAMSRIKTPTLISLGNEALDPKKLATLNNSTWLLASSQSLAEEERSALADGRWLAQQAAGIQGRFTVEGNAAYQLGQTLKVSGFGASFDGSALITGVQHHMSKGVWRTTLLIGQPLLQDVDADLVPRVSGVLTGVVASYQEDPARLNRLRVKVPELMQDDKPLWARFSTPYASKESGLCFYPEAGDEVVVAFLADDPCYPVILGAMHNPKNPPPFPPSAENSRKGIVFGPGDNKQQLMFDHQQGSATLQVGKDSLTLHQGVQLNSEQDGVLSAKNLTLESKQQIGISGNSGVKIKGAKVDLTN